MKTSNIPCLGFKQDPRGKIGYEENSEMIISVSDKIPIIGKWTDDFTLEDQDSPIKFTKVIPVQWITQRTIALACKVSFYYYDNSEFTDQGEKKMAEVIPIKRKGGIT
jgi:hypothetical protein